ncbi:MAG: hypothetical protein V4722_23985 [Bacteroidota bacterium]
MIIVKVTYTVKAAFADKNQENINVFIKDFQELDSKDFRYSVFVCADKKTFVHLSWYANEATQTALLDVASFKAFQ